MLRREIRKLKRKRSRLAADLDRSQHVDEKTVEDAFKRSGVSSASREHEDDESARVKRTFLTNALAALRAAGPTAFEVSRGKARHGWRFEGFGKSRYLIYNDNDECEIKAMPAWANDADLDECERSIDAVRVATQQMIAREARKKAFGELKDYLRTRTDEISRFRTKATAAYDTLAVFGEFNDLEFDFACEYEDRRCTVPARIHFRGSDQAEGGFEQTHDNFEQYTDSPHDLSEHLAACLEAWTARESERERASLK